MFLSWKGNVIGVFKDSLMTECGLRNLHNIAIGINNLFLDGDVIELGVYRGESSKILAEIFHDKKIHLFDTFEGLPDTTIEDSCIFSGNGMSDTSIEYVKEKLKNYNNVVINKGMFLDKCDYLKDVKFCFALFDGDLYQSAVDFFRFIYPRMVSGGLIFIDDYGDNEYFKGVTLAANNFFKEPIKTIKCYPQEIGIIQCL